MSTITNLTTSCSWDHDLIALRDEIFAQGGCTIREAAEMARNSIGMMAEYAASWDQDANTAMAAVYAPIFADAPAYEPEPTPPAAPAALPVRARDKAAYHLAGGLDIRRMGAAYLVPSGTRAGVIHRVQSGVCSCEARTRCWHIEAVEQLEELLRGRRAA
jgi:hypothetical protein